MIDRLAVLLLLAGCVSWQPSNGAMVTVTNRTADTIQLLLEDAPRDVERDGAVVRVVRVYPRGKIAPDKRQFFQWPFSASTGRLVTIQRGDTTRTPLLRIWDKLSWWVTVTPHGYLVVTEDR